MGSCIGAALCVIMMLEAAATMRREQMTYQNAYDLTVVAPGAILIGAFALVLPAIVT